MSKYHSELSEREKDLLLIRRASGAQSSQLAQMEKMLTQTKGLLDKKTEMGMEGKPCEGDTMVQDLEEKVQRSKRDRRNSLHRTQLLESQMKTVRGELVDTLDHLQELRNVLRRSQQQAEERKAAMEKLSTGLRETQQELEQRNEQVKDKDVALKDIQHELQQKDLQLSQLESAVKEHSSDMEQKLLFLQEATERSERELSERNKQLSQLESAVKEHSSDMEQKLLFLQEATERSERELSERNKQVAFLSERLELVKAQLQGKETLEEEAMWQDQQLRECREQLQGTAQGLQEMRSRCETLVVQLEESTVLGREKESQVGLLEEELARVAEQAAQTEDRLQDAMATLTLELEAVWRKHQAELAVLQDSQAEMMKASECVANTLRSSQELLSRELQHTRVQLDEAQHKAAALLAELRAREHLMHSTSEALLLKESEVTRLKTKISSFERGAELRSLSQSMGLSLPALTSNTSRNNSPPPHRSGERAAHSPARRPWVAAGDDGTREMPYGERDGERTLNPRDCALWTSLVSGQGAP
ncbi:coiled-coil domain-containing protein 18 [Clupea harengus]|uniref:Coiled-coil domain-containing protein 18 n=1 Tax=Clupea harengus TaxID=7950 RepID=A0A6P8G4D7_CLUHA|nr:coiled-coil domain-containing protein 18 [Clupea harengus]XP_031430412.1 coiled-coil domain-containing protein 18 [Clupea harengus]